MVYKVRYYSTLGLQRGGNIHLDVPAYRQEQNYTCVPSCCKMILDYVNLVKLGSSGPTLEESEIAEVMKTTIAGTHLRNVKNINSVLGSSNPSIRFVAEFETHTLADIRKELESGLPPAVWIVTSDGSNDYLHSVVITGIDDAKREISYNDPTYGEEKTISLSRFMDIWEAPGARMIKAEIRQATSDSLEQYMEQGGRAK